MRRTTAAAATATDGGRRALAAQDLGPALPRLHRAAVALCGSPHDADDLVQETLARVLARPRVVDGGDSLPYLLGAVRNTFLTQCRDESRRPRVAPLADDVEAPAQPEPFLDRAAVTRVLAALPPDLRRVLVAVDVVGLSYRETARAVRVPEGTVMSRLHRARRRAAHELEAAGVAPRTRPRE